MFSAKKILKYILIFTALDISVTYPTIIKNLEIKRLNEEEKISKRNIEKVLQEEKLKLGLTNSVGILFYEDNFLEYLGIGGLSAKGYSSEGYDYVVGLNSNTSIRIVLRHELYHIYRGDCNDADLFSTNRDKNNFFKFDISQDGKRRKTFLDALHNRYIQEPRAGLYSLFGWKI